LEEKYVAVDLSIALVHHPVLNKHGDIIASALTNLDLHDIARSSRTYGIHTFYVVTPVWEQQVLAQKIIDHWLDGFGGKYNPHRKAAVKLIKVMDSLVSVEEDIRQRRKKQPKMVGTSAKNVPESIGYNKLKSLLFDGDPYLLLFGTAWGLSEEIISQVDYFLEPISGVSGYNHLSVRSASAVILDRLLGRND
jgi:hypothetical protein